MNHTRRSYAAVLTACAFTLVPNIFSAIPSMASSVTVNGARFTAEGPSTFVTRPVTTAPYLVTFDMGLRIVNYSASAVAFRKMEQMDIQLCDSTGKVVPWVQEPEHQLRTMEPALETVALKRGESVLIPIRGTMWSKDARKTYSLGLELPSSGITQRFDRLPAGVYYVTLVYHNDAPNLSLPDGTTAPAWVGTAVAPPLTLDTDLNQPFAGHAPALPPPTSVTANGLEFTTTANYFHAVGFPPRLTVTLKVTNHTEKRLGLGDGAAVMFPQFADDTEIAAIVTHPAAPRYQPYSIPPNQTIEIPFGGNLVRDQTGWSVTLTEIDYDHAEHVGPSLCTVSGLHSGPYRVALLYDNRKYAANNMIPASGILAVPGPIWVGFAAIPAVDVYLDLRSGPGKSN